MREVPAAGKTATLFALMFAGLAAVAPFAIRGIACGHELAFHMDSWMEVAQQWRAGILYPDWAVNANYGSGDPRFVFYPPLSWIFGGALGSFLPWLFVPVAFDVCVVALSGWSMYVTASEWFGQPNAALVALVYALNPYMLLSIYARSAFAEMLAACFLPLVLLWIVRDRPARQMLIPLALTIAAVWLTNVPAAIVATYFAVLLLVVATILRRNSRVFLYGIGAIALGLALASFFLLPALYERNWVMLGQLLPASLRPQENFLFAANGSFEHDHFLRMLSWLALAEVSMTVLAMLAARRWRMQNPKLWWSLVVSAALAVILMLPVAGMAYRLMPDLHALQFPLRWLLVMGVAYAFFVVAALPSFRGKTWIYAFALIGLIVVCNRALQSACDPAETPFMVSNIYRTGYGYMGPDEYGANYAVKPDFPEFRLFGENGSAAIDARVTRSNATPYRKQLTIESPRPVDLVLRLMSYPAWLVEVNGQRVAPAMDRSTGRMIIALPTGVSQVDVRFARTPDRWLGDGISLAAAMVLCGFVLIRRKKAPDEFNNSVLPVHSVVK
jgi:hypothetical protein